MTTQSIKPFFMGTYTDTTIEDLSDELCEAINNSKVIPKDEDGFTDGYFEVIVNWING